MSGILNHYVIRSVFEFVGGYRKLIIPNTTKTIKVARLIQHNSTILSIAANCFICLFSK
jgi:hypothetical protein